MRKLSAGEGQCKQCRSPLADPVHLLPLFALRRGGSFSALTGSPANWPIGNSNWTPSAPLWRQRTRLLAGVACALRLSPGPSEIEPARPANTEVNLTTTKLEWRFLRRPFCRAALAAAAAEKTRLANGLPSEPLAVSWLRPVCLACLTTFGLAGLQMRAALSAGRAASGLSQIRYRAGHALGGPTRLKPSSPSSDRRPARLKVNKRPAETICANLIPVGYRDCDRPAGRQCRQCEHFPSQDEPRANRPARSAQTEPSEPVLRAYNQL